VTRSALSHLECPRCGLRHDAFTLQNVCTQCGSPLLARYDLDTVRSTVAPRDLVQREQTMWRYAELLPLQDTSSAVSFGETMTPLLPAPRLARELGIG